AMEGDAVHLVGDRTARARRLGRGVGIAQELLRERDAMTARSHRLISMDQLGEVELILVTVTHRVRTLHLAELALEALVHDLLRLLRRELAHIAAVALVDEGEERGK